MSGVVDFNQLMQFVSTAALNSSPPPPTYAEDPALQHQRRKFRSERGAPIPGSVEHENMTYAESMSVMSVGGFLIRLLFHIV